MTSVKPEVGERRSRTGSELTERTVRPCILTQPLCKIQRLSPLIGEKWIEIVCLAFDDPTSQPQPLVALNGGIIEVVRETL